MRFFCFALQELLGNRRFSLVSYKKLRMSTVDLGDMRIKYKERDEPFLEEHLVSKEPIGQFSAWFDEVKKCKDIIEPNAMCIATANKEGFPSARMVLLKGYSSDGFMFFTNYESRKGTDLEENPKAALLFYWPPFNRQVPNYDENISWETHIDGVPPPCTHSVRMRVSTTSQSPLKIGAIIADCIWSLLQFGTPGYFPISSNKVRIEGTVTKTTAEESREYFERRPLGSRVSAAVSPQSKPVPSRKHLEDAAAQLLEKGEVERPNFWGGYRLSPTRFEFWQGQSDRLHDRLVFTREREGWAIYRIAP